MLREGCLRFAAIIIARVAIRIHSVRARKGSVVEPFAAALPSEFEGTGAELVDLDTALEECGILIILVDHDVFRVVPAEERANALIYDSRGIWTDAVRPVVRTQLRVAR